MSSWVREVAERLYPTRRTEIDEDVRQRTYEALVADASLEDVKRDNAAASFILSEVKDEVKMKTAGMRNIEQKAGSQITIAGTLIAIFALLNHHMDQRWLILPLLILIGAIVLSICALWSRSDDLPSPGAYNFGETIALDNKPKIAMQLAEAWIGYSLDLQLKAGQRRRVVTAAWVAILLGVLGLLFVSIFHNGSQTGVVRCIMSLKDGSYAISIVGPEGQRRRDSHASSAAGQAGGRLQAQRLTDYVRCAVPI